MTAPTSVPRSHQPPGRHTRPARVLLGHFLRGLIFIAPVALTLYICWLIFRTIDGWLNLPVPGAGFLLTILVITLTGWLASNFLAQRIMDWIEDLVGRLPFVRLLYTAIKDVLGAFVGEKKRFDRPVIVTLLPGTGVRALGFLTQDSLTLPGLEDHVTVYLPQSYNFAGQMLVFPRSQVEILRAPSSELMAFIVSGGVTEMGDRRTDGPTD